MLDWQKPPVMQPIIYYDVKSKASIYRISGGIFIFGRGCDIDGENKRTGSWKHYSDMGV